MQEARHCGGRVPDRTCDEDILVTFGFTVCVSKPLDSTNLPWVILCMMIVSLVSAYTIAIVCITTNLDRSCCPESNRTAPAPLRQVQTAEDAGVNETVIRNLIESRRGGAWYCAAFPDSVHCADPTTIIELPSWRTSTPTTPPQTTTPTTSMTPSTPRTWCKCPAPSANAEHTVEEESFKLTFKVEREVDGARRVETIVGNEIFLDAETEVELEMEGCEQVKTNIMKYNEMMIPIDEQ